MAILAAEITDPLMSIFLHDGFCSRLLEIIFYKLYFWLLSAVC